MKNKLCKLLLDNDHRAYDIIIRFRSFLHDIFVNNRELYHHLFICKEAQEVDSLPSDNLDEFCRFGLLSYDDNTKISSGVMVHRNLMDIEGESMNPAPEWFIVTDWPDISLEDGEIGEWAVFPIHYESIYLLRTLREDNNIRSPIGKEVLDIFCGSGIFGVYAALDGAEAVVCADINERALAFTRLNSILNGVEGKVNLSKSNIFEYQGFESLSGRTFDLILANPPFEPVPHSSHDGDESPYYRHSNGGQSGQDVILKFLVQVSSYVREGGRIVAVDFSPGKSVPFCREYDTAVYAYKAIRDLFSSDQGLQPTINILDSMPLDVFGTRFLALAHKGYVLWQHENWRNRFDELYFLWLEVSFSGMDCYLKDRRKEHLVRHAAWENPYHWPLPSGISRNQQPEWCSIYLAHWNVHQTNRSQLVLEQLLSHGDYHSFFDFSTVMESRDQRIKDAVIQHLSGICDMPFFGMTKPKKVELVFVPNTADGVAKGLAIELDSDAIVSSSVDISIEKIRKDLRTILDERQDCIILTFHILKHKTANISNYDDLVDLDIIWRNYSYPLNYNKDRGKWDYRHSDRIQNMVDQIGEKAFTWDSDGSGEKTRVEEVSQTYLFYFWFENLVIDSECTMQIDHIWQGRDLPLLHYLYRQCLSDISRHLTVLANATRLFTH